MELVVFPRWIIVQASRLLTAPDWLRLGEKGLEAAIHVLNTNREAVTGVAIECGLQPALAKICGMLICGNSEPSRPAFSKRCGPIQLQYYSMPTELEYTNWASEIWDSLAAAPGILTTIYKIFKFAAKRGKSGDGLRPLLESVGGNIEMLCALPSHLSAFLPELDLEENHSRIDWGNLLPANATQHIQIGYIHESPAPGSAGAVHPFKLRMPSEADLLPHILDASVEQSVDWFHPFDDDARHVRGREAIERSVVEFLPDPAPLQALIGNEDLSSAVRAAGAMLYLLHPQRDRTLQPI